MNIDLRSGTAERIGRAVGYLGVIFLIGYVAIIAFGVLALVGR